MTNAQKILDYIMSIPKWNLLAKCPHLKAQKSLWKRSIRAGKRQKREMTTRKLLDIAGYLHIRSCSNCGSIYRAFQCYVVPNPIMKKEAEKEYLPLAEELLLVFVAGEEEPLFSKTVSSDRSISIQ